jgi:SAM-dependent methyltransferase
LDASNGLNRYPARSIRKRMVETQCRACGAGPLEQVLSLGWTPLANSLIAGEDLTKPELTFPLDLAFCSACTLVQITETVPPEKMFSDYLYFSSFSDTMLKHAEALAARIVSERSLSSESLVVEVASNDGYLLQYYQRAGVPVLGIEPARNVAEVAVEQKKIPTLVEFFGRELGERLRQEGRRADVVHSHNVFAHVPDVNGFTAGVARMLEDDGVWVIETPYARDLVEHCEFDTIYHEHLFYYSATALDRLFARHGLVMSDVEHIPMHGGSLRVYASREGTSRTEAVGALLAEEARIGMDGVAFYRAFGKRVEALRDSFRATVLGLKTDGKRIAAYGAAAKGTTLLTYMGLGSETIEFVADRSPHKQGRYMPGSHIPIVEPSRLLDAKPDYCVLLTWNFAKEILEQQSAYRAAGGRFIVPVPEVRIL